MEEYKRMKEKEEHLKALTAAMILSEYCQQKADCSGCIFEISTIETLPCLLMRTGVPQGWDKAVLRRMREVTQ